MVRAFFSMNNTNFFDKNPRNFFWEIFFGIFFNDIKRVCLILKIFLENFKWRTVPQKAPLCPRKRGRGYIGRGMGRGDIGRGIYRGKLFHVEQCYKK